MPNRLNYKRPDTELPEVDAVEKRELGATLTFWGVASLPFLFILYIPVANIVDEVGDRLGRILGFQDFGSTCNLIVVVATLLVATLCVGRGIWLLWAYRTRDPSL